MAADGEGSAIRIEAGITEHAVSIKAGIKLRFGDKRIDPPGTGGQSSMPWCRIGMRICVPSRPANPRLDASEGTCHTLKLLALSIEQRLESLLFTGVDNAFVRMHNTHNSTQMEASHKQELTANADKWLCHELLRKMFREEQSYDRCPVRGKAFHVEQFASA